MTERRGRRTRGGAAGPSSPPSRRPGAPRPGGSSPATRRTSRVPQPDTPTEQRRGATFTSRALILLLVLAVLGVSYASSIRAWLNLRSEQHTLSAQIAAQRAAIASLRHQSQRWNDPAYIESMARLRFGWVMPGERSYRVIGTDGKVLTAGHDAITSPPASGTAQPPWWSGATGSLARADAPPAPQHQAKPARHPDTLIGPSSGRSSGQPSDP